MKLMRTIKNGGVYCIAEMSANHAQKLENALAIVRAAKDAGADCVKIQTYTADTMTIDSNKKYFKINGGLWDGYNLYKLYQEAHTPWEWTKPIMDEAAACGLDFLSTPFDKTAVDFLDELGVGCYKIASFELVDIPLIEYTASKGKPMIVSCGMGNTEEIQDAVDAILGQGNDQLVLLKCTSEYPAHFEDMNLSAIPDMQNRFGVPVGLSDHSFGSLAPVAAVALGACVIEKHFCLDRKIKNPDSDFSMEPDEFRRMVEDVRAVKAALGQPVYTLTEREQASTVFRRSLFTVRDIAEGEAFTPENVRCIRPGYGLKPKEYAGILGKNAIRSIERGEPLTREDFCE